MRHAQMLPKLSPSTAPGAGVFCGVPPALSAITILELNDDGEDGEQPIDMDE